MAKVVVIGAGLSGLAFAWYLKKNRPDWELVILEKDHQPGGKARTVYRDGFLCEAGVNGVLDNKPFTLALAKELGLTPMRSNDASRNRFVIKNGRPVEMPSTASSFLTSPLLSVPGRLRVIGEAFVPKGDLSKEESLEEFACRRLGREAFEALIDPMATGIYAGDPAKLSLKSCFPRIYQLEEQYGSLIRAMLKMQLAAKKKGKKGPGAGPGGTLTSFEQGMTELVDALRQALGSSLRLGCGVTEIHKEGDEWLVDTVQGDEIRATHCVVACPAPQAAKLFESSVPSLSEVASSVYYPPIAVVSFGVSEKKLGKSLNGFGFLVPGPEKRRILGSLWDSSIFQYRAPHGHVLVRTLVGGARAPMLALLPDSQLIHLVHEELRDLMGFNPMPDFVNISRWQESIPQYRVGHGDLENRLFRVLKGQGHLYVRANWVGGVSLNDCIMNSLHLADEVAAGY